MNVRRLAALVIGFLALGLFSRLNANSCYGYDYYWWQPHRVEEIVRTDTFSGEIASITNSTITVKGQEVMKRRVYWTTGYRTSVKPVEEQYRPSSDTPSTPSAQEQTFTLSPSCRIFLTDGSRTLVSKLQVRGRVTVKYSSDSKNNRVADEITASPAKS